MNFNPLHNVRTSRIPRKERERERERSSFDANKFKQDYHRLVQAFTDLPEEEKNAAYEALVLYILTVAGNFPEERLGVYGYIMDDIASLDNNSDLFKQIVLDDRVQSELFDRPQAEQAKRVINRLRRKTLFLGALALAVPLIIIPYLKSSAVDNWNEAEQLRQCLNPEALEKRLNRLGFASGQASYLKNMVCNGEIVSGSQAKQVLDMLHHYDRANRLNENLQRD